MDWFLLAFGSALFSAVSAIAQKKILFKMGAFQFTFLNSVLTLFFTIPFFFSIKPEMISINGLLIVFFKTTLNALAFYYVMQSIKNLELSKALPLLVLTPGLVALFAYLFLGESLTGNQFVGILLLLVGTYILEMQNKKDFLEPFQVFIKSENYRHIVMALLLFTTSAILDKYILKDLIKHPTTFLAIHQVFTALIFFGASFFVKGGPINLVTKTESAWWKWIIIIAILTIGYRYTQIEAIKYAPAVALVLAVKRISVFFAALIGGKIFNESKLIQKAIATAIMIIGTFLIVS